jgi:uncharacterized protein YcbK (DUF882 family)
MNLSPNFTLAELTRSRIAAQHGIDNTPPPEAIENLKILARDILQPIRDMVGKPILVTSGYRCEALNKLVGGVSASQHQTGEAADIKCPGMSTVALAKAIKEAVPPITYDQLILEMYQPGVPHSGWVHVSVAVRGMTRRQALTYDGKQYLAGIPSEERTLT